MQLSLPVEVVPEIRILRHKQADATFSFANNKLSKEDAEALCRKLQSLASTTTIHYFRFSSLTGTYIPAQILLAKGRVANVTEDLYQYQALTTGFSVLFDGLANT